MHTTPMIVENRRLTELTATLACLLGKDWTFSPNLDANMSNEPFRVQHIAHKDGYSIGVMFGQYPLKNRLVIDGDYPRDSAGSYITPRTARLDEAAAAITVSADKEPAAIVKDIQRRLLPIFVPQWHACKAHADSNNAFEAGKQAAIAEITSTGIVEFRKESSEGHISMRSTGVYGNVRVNSSTSLEVMIRGLSVEQVKSILDVIRG